jgi:hypothetical protein
MVIQLYDGHAKVTSNSRYLAIVLDSSRHHKLDACQSYSAYHDPGKDQEG